VTPGNEELVRVVTSLIVTLPAVAAIIISDERRLAGAQLERAWPPQSRDCAIFALLNVGVPQLAVLVHFIRTRRTILGAIIGWAWVTAIVLCDVVAQFAAVATVDWLGL
jgi:hypothetical protein